MGVQACDAAGVLVMQEFWMTGDNNGRWAGEFDWPLDHALFAESAADAVRMLRSHASLMFWCGGNELFPKERNPNPNISQSYMPSTLESLRQHLRPVKHFGPLELKVCEDGAPPASAPWRRYDFLLEGCTLLYFPPSPDGGAAATASALRRRGLARRLTNCRTCDS